MVRSVSKVLKASQMNDKNVQVSDLLLFQKTIMKLRQIYSVLPTMCGVSKAEYWSLILVQAGFLTQRQIGKQLSISPQTLCSAFKQLQEKNLVHLYSSQENQRIKQIVLTLEGIQFVKNKLDPVQQVERGAWESLADDEKALLIRLLHKYIDLLENELARIQFCE